jgi:hypothetical protein
MTELSAYGLAIAPPNGWETPGVAAPEGERSFPVVHVATIALPMDAADYGSDVVGDLGANDALIVLKEFDPAAATSKLFARSGMPRKLKFDAFDPSVLQRSLPGHAGYQAFFHEADRAFCLYIVLGAYRQRAWVVPEINSVLSTLTIEPLA